MRPGYDNAGPADPGGTVPTEQAGPGPGGGPCQTGLRPGPGEPGGLRPDEAGRRYGVADRIGERAGAIVVKDIRLLTRGPAFGAAFMVVLLLALVAVVVGEQGAGTRGPVEQTGPEAFSNVTGVLIVAILGVAPWIAFRSMADEQEGPSFDLLKITGLGGRRIVLGKFAAASVITMLFGSVLVPFITFSYLLGGVGIVSVIGVTGWLVLAAMPANMLGIAIGATASRRPAGTLRHLVTIAVLSINVLIHLAALPTMVREFDGFLAPSAFWMALLMVLFFYAFLWFASFGVAVTGLAMYR